MAKKTKKKTSSAAAKSSGRSSDGPGSLVLGSLAWFFGDISRQNAFDWTKNILIALGLALLIRWPLAEPYKIPSQSMHPTLNGDPRFLRGDRVFVNKFVYGVRVPFMNKRLWRGQDPQRWDIVVFQSPDPHAEHPTLIKRLVGLPGERIHIADGKVYANGQPLELPPSMPRVRYSSPGPGQYEMRYGILNDDAYAVVPPGHYLMLGDNSDNSRDGRYFGWVPNENIVGRAFCIWWPLTRCRDFTGFSRTPWWRAIVTLLGLLVLLRLFFGRSWRVPHDNLGAAVTAGEHLYINRCALGIPLPFTRRRVSAGRSLQRGEIVAYHAPNTDHAADSLSLGWVAGLPGEQVFLDDGRLVINGVPVTAPPPMADAAFASTINIGPFGRSKSHEYSLVPEGHYFVLSADPSETPDSRTQGWIPRTDVVGTAFAVWWPLGKCRRIRPC